MAHTLVFPGKYFFYPIGNTSAVSLLRDIGADEPASVLLLGCGDPRSVLYTIFCERDANRPLDFTCCDIDSAILARNVLLFTLVADDQLKRDVIWNIFFHFFLDKPCLTSLITQCRKLLLIGDSLRQWEASAYGPYIRMGTQYTYSEIRRHWTLYVEFQTLSVDRKKAIVTAFRNTLQSRGVIGSQSARSAGPFTEQAAPVCTLVVANYHRTGTTFLTPKDVSAATMINPTFAYSLAGEGCNVHYGTDPIAPFHLAALFGNGGNTIPAADIIATAKLQFAEWCTAFRSVATSKNSTLLIRLFAADALVLCKYLNTFRVSGTVELGIPVAQWKTQIMQLNRAEYGNAPATFNVIDTSNLTDHSGLLNVLIAAVPLLRRGGGVIYTESLIYHGPDATKEFVDRLFGDIQTVGFLLGVLPIDYVSGFSSRSNTHELQSYKAGERATQFHQMTTWKTPSTSDPLVMATQTPHPPTWDSQQLGTLLYDIYHNLFEQEDAMHFWRLNKDNVARAVAGSNIVHYMRETFVLFLKLVRENFHLESTFSDVMQRFIALKEADKSLPMDSMNYQELAGQLHLHGIYTVPWLRISPKKGRLAAWDTLPLLVRVILVVPREKFAVLERLSTTIGTPVLQCDIRGTWTMNIFSAVHAAFGTVVSVGTKRQPRVIFQEDPEGRQGSAPVVVSFVVSAGLLSLEPLKNVRVCLSIRTTPAAVTHVIQELGMEQSLFSANLGDEDRVHILPQNPFPTPSKVVLEQAPPIVATQIGPTEAVAVELDSECELIQSLSSLVHVEDEAAKDLFSAGVMPEISQISPCVMRLVIGSRVQSVVFPVPIIGSEFKLKLARKSSYIDIIVPPAVPFKRDGMKTLPFPVVGVGRDLQPWNIHRVNLACSPPLKAKKNNQKKWLNVHLKSMLSTREHALRKAHEDDALMRVKDMLNTIFLEVGNASVIRIVEKDENVCDTILFFSDLRLDLGSHTVICDGYVLSLTNAILSEVSSHLPEVANAKTTYNLCLSKRDIAGWKQLVPALAERCRSWKHVDTCEYGLQHRVPLSVEIGHDPLCSCGKGQDVAGIKKVAQWSPFVPFVVRVALSPLFAVSYLERIGRDPEAGRCFVCRGKGKPKMQACSGCGKVRYCSKECQKTDWKAHKPRCKQAVVKVGSSAQ
ncbi:hypothetical protein C8F01DRAFT_1189544 [Mycena amicta]|nr:hypothetical protein C8F01DRAFT_1189544 [Mycena amicta]